MKRLRRILFNTLTAISLLLALATAGLWVRSYSLTDSLCWGDASGHQVFTTASGKLVWNWNAAALPPTPGRDQSFRYEQMTSYIAPTYANAYSPVQTGDTFPTWQFAGAGWYTVRNTGVVRSITGVVPFAYLVGGMCFLPVYRILCRVHSRRNQCAGHCPVCGYDVRANPAKCSECGHEITAKTAVDTIRA